MFNLTLTCFLDISNFLCYKSENFMLKTLNEKCLTNTTNPEVAILNFATISVQIIAVVFSMKILAFSSTEYSLMYADILRPVWHNNCSNYCCKHGAFEVQI